MVKSTWHGCCGWSSPRWWVRWCGVLEGGLRTVGLSIREWDVCMGGSFLWCNVRCRSFVWLSRCVVSTFVKINIMFYSLSLLSVHYFMVFENSWPNTMARPPWCVLLVYYSSPRYFISCICVVFSSWLRMGTFVVYFKINVRTTFHVGLCDPSKIVFQVHCNRRVECCEGTSPCALWIIERSCLTALASFLRFFNMYKVWKVVKQTMSVEWHSKFSILLRRQYVLLGIWIKSNILLAKGCSCGIDP